MTVRADNTKTATWSNWKQGDSFGLGLSNVEDVPEDAYQAFNMQVYKNGTLGVRPWMRTTDATAGTTVAGTITDIRALHWVPVTPFSDYGDAGGLLLYHNYFHTTNSSADFYRFYDSIGATEGQWQVSNNLTGISTPLNAGPFFGVANANEWDFYSINQDITVAGAQVYRDIFDSTGASFTFPASWAPTAFTVWKARAYTWGDVSDPYRIHYSNADDFETWDTDDFVNIGVAGASGGVIVGGLFATSDALLIYRMDGIWHTLTGASPSTGNLRELSKARIPQHPKGGLVFKNQILFLGENGMGVTIMTPSGQDLRLDDVRPRALPKDPRTTADQHITVREALASYHHDSMHFFFVRAVADATSQWGSMFKSIDYVNDSFNMSGYWIDDERTDGSFAGTGDYVGGVVMMNDHVIAMVTDENDLSASYTPKIYTRDITLNRPSKSDDEWSDKAEYIFWSGATAHLAAGQVRLRYQAPGDGGLIRVRRVIVDVEYWKRSTLYQDPAMSCDTVGQVSGTTNLDTWDGSTLADIADDDRPVFHRIIFRNGDVAFDEEVSVELNDIQSLAIRKVTVEYEVRGFLDRG